MRIVRVIVGMLLLTVGVPVLLIGAVLWTAAEHRAPGGAFGGSIPRVENPGTAIVVTDLDALLRRDAPFTRARDTGLRLEAVTGSGPAFVGIGTAPQVAAYLDRLPHARVDAVGVARGPLPLRLTRVPGAPGAAPTPAPPVAQPFWVAQGVGALDWSPTELRGRQLSLVVMSPDGRPVTAADLRVEVRLGWLDAARWTLLTLGVLLIVSGMAVLAWPIRAPKPKGTPPVWPVPTGRPATLADAPAPKRPLPQVSLTLTAARLEGPLPLRKPIGRAPSNRPSALSPPPDRWRSNARAGSLAEGVLAESGTGAASEEAPAPAAARPRSGMDAPPPKRRRKTAGGLPAPDVLPVVVPPPNMPPKSVMTGRGQRRASAGSAAAGGGGPAGND